MENPSLLNTSNLAFMGDAVYGLLVREKLCKVNRPSGKLHALSVNYVSAAAQRDAFQIIEPLLTEEEMSVFKRGRNRHSGSLPKNADSKTYHIATGVETLFGWLYLGGKNERARALFDTIWEQMNNNC